MLLAGAAHGDNDAASYREAKRLMGEAKRLGEQGHNAEARLKLKEACSIQPGYGCLRSLASVELLMGLYVDAYEHFVDGSRKEGFTRADAQERADFERERQEAYAHTGHVEIVAPTNAVIYLDGTLVGAAPLASAVTVAPGKHTVEERSTDATHTQDMMAGAGVVSRVEFSVTPPSPQSAPVPAPAAPLPPDPAVAQETAPVVLAERPRWWSTRRTVGVITLGVGVASFAADYALWRGGKDASTAASHNGYVVPTWITFGVGVAGIATGAVLVLWPDSRAGQTAVVPFVTPSSGGLQLRREF
jgi:hypothetical protein